MKQDIRVKIIIPYLVNSRVRENIIFFSYSAITVLAIIRCTRIDSIYFSLATSRSYQCSTKYCASYKIIVRITDLKWIPKRSTTNIIQDFLIIERIERYLRVSIESSHRDFQEPPDNTHCEGLSVFYGSSGNVSLNKYSQNCISL